MGTTTATPIPKQSYSDGSGTVQIVAVPLGAKQARIAVDRTSMSGSKNNTVVTVDVEVSADAKTFDYWMGFGVPDAPFTTTKSTVDSGFDAPLPPTLSDTANANRQLRITFNVNGASVTTGVSVAFT